MNSKMMYSYDYKLPSRFKQGYYIPEYPEKYVGDITKIFYRSSWELIFMRKYCDLNKNCISWASEEIIIPYVNPVDNKTHNYMVDFFCVLKEGDNKRGVFIEIKPYAEKFPPKMKEGKRPSSKQLLSHNKRMTEYIKNIAKWNALKYFAAERNCSFIIVDEYDLGLKNKKNKPCLS